MGKVSEKSMDRKEPDSKSQAQDENKDRKGTANTHGSTVEETRLFRCISHTTSSTTEGVSNTSHLAASTSSPCLLTGCGDTNTHAGADFERHVHAHNVRIVSQSPPLSPIPCSPHPTLTDVAPSFHTSPLLTPPSPPLPSDSDSDIPPDSVFLTPVNRRSQLLIPARPSSAPASYLEKISGTLLRLVGDHYLCCTCGRQLRAIGDEMEFEANINHIRRALSATHLNTNEN